MTEREASCSCGRVRLTVSAEPVRLSMCHCLACQRRTGSVFGAQAWFPREAVDTCGETHRYRRVADSGHHIDYHFCPSCGSTVWYEAEVMPALIAVPVGAFADPGFPQPGVSVYESRKHSWVHPPPDVEHHE
jgi:hypothetical protein